MESVICNYCHTNNVWSNFNLAQATIPYKDGNGWEPNPYPHYTIKQCVCHNCGNIVVISEHIKEEQ